MTALVASASVSDDDTRLPGPRIAALAAESRSSSAATNALDSTYRRARATSAVVPTARVRRRRGAPVGVLRFATVAVDQRSSRTARQPDVRPFLERIAVLNRWLNDASCQQRVVVTTAGLRDQCRGNELGDDASMRGHRDAFSSLDSADVAAQIVLEFSNAGFHPSSIATCGRMWNQGEGLFTAMRSAHPVAPAGRSSDLAQTTEGAPFLRSTPV